MRHINIVEMNGSEKQIAYAHDIINNHYDAFIQKAEWYDGRKAHALSKGNTAKAEESENLRNAYALAADLYAKCCNANADVLNDAHFVINEKTLGIGSLSEMCALVALNKFNADDESCSETLYFAKKYFNLNVIGF